MSAMNLTTLCAAADSAESMECALWSVSADHDIMPSLVFAASFALAGRQVNFSSFSRTFANTSQCFVRSFIQMLEETKAALDETKETQAGILQGTDTFFLLFGVRHRSAKKFFHGILKKIHVHLTLFVLFFFGNFSFSNSPSQPELESFQNKREPSFS